MQYIYVLFFALACCLPLKSSAEQLKLKKTAVVLDWDDTLLPTKFLDPFIDREKSLEEALKNFYAQKNDELSTLDHTIQQLIEKMEHDADVFLVSSADKAWIKLTSLHLLPKTYQKILSLEEKHRLHSAKEVYFRAKPEMVNAYNLMGTAIYWKDFAFKELFKDYGEVISIGDSDAERLAVFSICETPECLTACKSLKVQVPAVMSRVSDQLALVSEYWETVLRLKGDYDLKMLEDEDEKLGVYISSE